MMSPEMQQAIIDFLTTAKTAIILVTIVYCLSCMRFC